MEKILMNHFHYRDGELYAEDVPLARIAEQVGYESEAAFNRAFKRSFGVPPAAWRKGAPA